MINAHFIFSTLWIQYALFLSVGIVVLVVAFNF